MANKKNIGPSAKRQIKTQVPAAPTPATATPASETPSRPPSAKVVLHDRKANITTRIQTQFDRKSTEPLNEHTIPSMLSRLLERGLEIVDRDTDWNPTTIDGEIKELMRTPLYEEASWLHLENLKDARAQKTPEEVADLTAFYVALHSIRFFRAGYFVAIALEGGAR